MAEICAGRDPGARVGVDFFCDGERAVEEVDGLGEVVEVVENDGELVEEEGVGLAELERGVEVFLR